MKDHPILFSTEMVRAILDGRKSQTRRVIKPQPVLHTFPGDRRQNPKVGWVIKLKDGSPAQPGSKGHLDDYPCPYGQPGDLLWVRETWHTDTTDLVQARAEHEDVCSSSPIYYKSTHGKEYPDAGYIWRPSIHLPKWACQLWLKITDIRVERVQEISEEDAKAEGLKIVTDGLYNYYRFDDWNPCDSDDHAGCSTPTGAFSFLWDTINLKRGYSWESNPWVWVIGYERVERCP